MQDQFLILKEAQIKVWYDIDMSIHIENLRPRLKVLLAAREYSIGPLLLFESSNNACKCGYWSLYLFIDLFITFSIGFVILQESYPIHVGGIAH